MNQLQRTVADLQQNVSGVLIPKVASLEQRVADLESTKESLQKANTKLQEEVKELKLKLQKNSETSKVNTLSPCTFPFTDIAVSGRRKKGS